MTWYGKAQLEPWHCQMIHTIHSYEPFSTDSFPAWKKSATLKKSRGSYTASRTTSLTQSPTESPTTASRTTSLTQSPTESPTTASRTTSLSLNLPLKVPLLQAKQQAWLNLPLIVPLLKPNSKPKTQSPTESPTPASQTNNNVISFPPGKKVQVWKNPEDYFPAYLMMIHTIHS